MDEINKKIVLSVKKEVEVEEISFNYFSCDELSKKYAIVKIEEDLYAVIEKETKEVLKYFKNFEKLQNENSFLIELDNGKKQIMHFRGYAYRAPSLEWSVEFSEEINSLLKEFKSYLLVITNDNKRRIISLRCVSKFHEWAYYDTQFDDLVVMELLNGKHTILIKDGLRFNDKIEFKSLYLHNENEFVTVWLDNNKYKLIRLKDLSVSKEVDSFEYYHSSRGNRSGSSNYVIVHCNNIKKVAIMRVSDFNISDTYDSITDFSYHYALVEKAGKESVLRLKDFKEAKWEDD